MKLSIPPEPLLLKKHFKSQKRNIELKLDSLSQYGLEINYQVIYGKMLDGVNL
jgi:hypothetical protein